jgi:hypothetical protein
MKIKIKNILSTILTMAILAIGISTTTQPITVSASGGSGGGGGTITGVDTIKVNKCYYFDAGSYVELLLQAVSSESSAHIYAYLPDGTYLGEVQNGGGGRYGGTVFLCMRVPASITFISSSGGSITITTQLMQL